MICPVPYCLIPTSDSESYKNMPVGCTGLPLTPHPGAFGVRRRFHNHEGVDLYVPNETPIVAMESGVILAVRQFTGLELGQPWWNKTWAVWVQGPTGVFVYGEILPIQFSVGEHVRAGQLLGHVTQVLQVNKGRPMSMLHLELHEDGSTEAPEWNIETLKPTVLRDPTPFLKLLA